MYCCGAQRSQQIHPWLNKPGEGVGRRYGTYVWPRRSAKAAKEQFLESITPGMYRLDALGPSGGWAGEPVTCQKERLPFSMARERQAGAAAGQKECVRVGLWILTRVVHAAMGMEVGRWGGPRFL